MNQVLGMETGENINTSELASVDTFGLTEELKKYNSSFGMGASMANITLGILRRNPEKEQDEAGAIHEQEADEVLTLEELKSRTDATLKATGLEFEAVNPGWNVSGNEGAHQGVELRLNLKDGKQFVSYLETLNPQNITSSQKEGLKEVAQVLLIQLTNEYNLDNPEDERMIELMGSLSNIISEYERLDDEKKEMTASVERLKKYLEIAREGYLREFRIAENLSLDKPLEEKGFVLHWHKDANLDFLKRKWDAVIDALQHISQNEKAKKIYPQAAQTATEAIGQALAEVSSWEDTDKGYYAQKKDFLRILEVTKLRLSEF